jgi:uncharacterized protein (TIRG00374 family)
MAKVQSFVSTRKIHVWRYLPILVILGLAVHLLVPQITSLKHSWSVVHNLTWWAVSLAVLSQVLSYLGSGYVLHMILRSNRQDLSVARGALITLASYSIGLVAGGWVTGAAATFGWVRRESHDNNTAVLAGTLPALLNDVVLVSVALIGSIYLLVLHDLSTTQMIEFGIVLLLLSLLVAIVVVVLRFPGLAGRLVTWVGSHWAKLFHRHFNPDSAVARMNSFIKAWHSIRHGAWLGLALGAVANVVFDMLTLYCLFIAAGHAISPGVLLAGYGLPIILGRIAFIIPGGVGVVEGSMVALYDTLKVPDAVSVVVILGYRLISFWLPTILGFVAAAYLGGSPFRTKNEKVHISRQHY